MKILIPGLLILTALSFSRCAGGDRLLEFEMARGSTQEIELNLTHSGGMFNTSRIESIEQTIVTYISPELSVKSLATDNFTNSIGVTMEIEHDVSTDIGLYYINLSCYYNFYHGESYDFTSSPNIDLFDTPQRNTTYTSRERADQRIVIKIY